jgi:hypothetical protein
VPAARDNKERAKLSFRAATIFSRENRSILPQDHKESRNNQRETERIWFTDKAGAKIGSLQGPHGPYFHSADPKSCAIQSFRGPQSSVHPRSRRPVERGSTLIWSEKIFNGCDSIHTVEMKSSQPETRRQHDLSRRFPACR